MTIRGYHELLTVAVSVEDGKLKIKDEEDVTVLQDTKSSIQQMMHSFIYDALTPDSDVDYYFEEDIEELDDKINRANEFVFDFALVFLNEGHKPRYGVIVTNEQGENIITFFSKTDKSVRNTMQCFLSCAM